MFLEKSFTIRTSPPIPAFWAFFSGKFAPSVPVLHAGRAHFALPRKLPMVLPAFFLCLVGCTFNPALEREQLILVSDTQVEAMAASSWTDVKSQMQPSQDTAVTRRVNRVGNKILRAIGETPSEWEFAVFKDSSLNAFALPGGKVGIHTGMLDFCRNDDELAVIIGHEIAHVKLRHASERISQQLALQGIIDVVAPSQSDANALLGIGTTLGVTLPFSRKHETEADRLGLQYVWRAGFDPYAAVGLWTRMSADTSRPRQPEFLSTHPTDDARIKAVRREALRLKSFAVG